MAKQKSFIRYLDLDNRVRASFQTEKRRIKRFVVQYETFLQDQWHPVIRYDTAHGFAHVDLLDPAGKTEKITIEAANYNEAFTFAQEDINSHWEHYLAAYLRKVRK